MSYFTIIIIGYLINYLFVIIYAYLMYNRCNVEYLKGVIKSIDTKQTNLINKSINPFRGKDFITLLPFGYAMLICTKICVSKNKFIDNIYDEFKDKEMYLEKLEKENNERTKNK